MSKLPCKTQVLAAWLLLSLGFAPSHTAFGAPPIQVESISAIADRLASEPSSRNLHDDAGAIFRKASDDELRGLTLHKDPGVALTAAWQRISRTLPEEYEQEPKPLPASDVHWFLGFVEGRLSVRPPRWWADALLALEAHSRYAIDLPRKAARRLSFAASQSGYYVPAGLAAAKRGDSIVLTIDKSTCTMPADTIWNSRGRGSHLMAAHDGPDWFVATHSAAPRRYSLMRVDPDSGKVRWTTDVWATDYYYGLSGPSEHWATLTVKDDAIIVFGLVNGSAYIEAFRKSDGKNLFRFSSRLIEAEKPSPKSVD
jgi:hypothetical protein